MHDKLPKSYRRISINSHPRSGSVFLVTNLANILYLATGTHRPFGLYAITKAPMSWITDSPEDFQVVVIRNPKDTIFSSYAHGEKGNPNSVPTQQGILGQIDRYIEHMDTYIRLKNNIHFYDFNDLEYALKDIALNFISELPSGFASKPPEKTGDHTPSMKGSDFYTRIEKLQLKDNIFEEANKKYKEALKLCKKPG